MLGTSASIILVNMLATFAISFRATIYILKYLPVSFDGKSRTVDLRYGLFAI